MDKKSRIVIAGEIYSSNLGDGIIADSMQFMIKRVMPGRQLVLLDISGRKEVRSSYLDLVAKPNGLDWGPRKLASYQNLAKWILLRKRRYSSLWESILETNDVLVVGGGQLLMDNELDFPLKISRLVKLATALNNSVHFSACGVSERWSKTATKLFDRALQHAVTITVRDSSSADFLERHLSISPTAITSDPAVWAEKIYGHSPSKNQSISAVGLGVMSPKALNKRRRQNESFSKDSIYKFWKGVLTKLDRDGFSVELFTNGALEDYAFAKVLQQRLSEESLHVSLAERPTTPEKLAHNLSRYVGIVAFRLHANIVAFSYGIPSIGLVWTNKVKDFYESTKRAQYCLGIEDFEPVLAYERLIAALEEGIDTSVIKASQQIAMENMFVIDKEIKFANSS